MSRYLARPFIVSALHRGKPVEQFLGAREVDGERILRWIELSPASGDAVEIRVRDVYDEGDESYLDLYDFTEVESDDDEEDDDDAPSATAASLDEAIALCRDRWGADPDRWVNEGVIQDEYADLLREGGD
jgi:hypothetical protein